MYICISAISNFIQMPETTRYKKKDSLIKRVYFVSRSNYQTWISFKIKLLQISSKLIFNDVR